MSHSWPHEAVPIHLKQQQPACSFCRVRKLKCDGLVPACSSCIKFDRADSCSLRTQQHGQDKDYKGYLERRIRFLEERLSSHLPGEEFDDDENTAFTQLVKEVDATSLELPSDLRYNLSPSETIVAFACVGGCFEGETQQNLLSLPQKDTGSKLIEYYLEHVHAVNLPFISTRLMWTQFDLVYSSSKEPEKCHNDYNTACFNVLMAMAIAITSLSQNGQSILYSASSAFFRRASSHFRNYLVNSKTMIDTIQGLLFLIQYGMLNPSDIHVGYLITVGVRMCAGFQLDRNLRTNDEAQQDSRSLRWSMYSFDRSFCIARSLPCTFADEVWQLHVYEEDKLYYAQKCRIIQLKSAIFEPLYRNLQVSPGLVEGFASRVATWDQQNTQLTTIRFMRLLRMEYYHAMILLYRPCPALRERSPEDLLHLWTYSLEFAQAQRDCAAEILDLTSSAEWAFTTGISLIYSYQEIVRRKPHRSTTNAAGVRLSLLWTGVQNVSHVLQTVARQWTDARNILHRLENIVEKSISAVEDLMNGCENITFPSDVSDIWRHASVTNDLLLNRGIRNREQDEIGELAWDIIYSNETGQQTLR